MSLMVSGLWYEVFIAVKPVHLCSQAPPADGVRVRNIPLILAVATTMFLVIFND